MKKIKYPDFNIEEVENINYMFYRCESLKKIIIYDFKFNKHKNSKYLFYGCKLLKCEYF